MHQHDKIMFPPSACGYVYIIVPKSSPSPDCDPVGQRFYLMCGGYVTTSIDIEWYWSPDLVTPGIEVTWLTITSINGGTVSSGPYTGYLIEYSNLDSYNDFALGHVGYYWCRFKDTVGSQEFVDSPKMLLDTTPITSCVNNINNYIDMVDICAEAVVLSSTIEVVPTSTTLEQTQTSETPPSTAQISLTPSSTPTLTTANGFCCGVALYAGMASCVVTASAVFVVGGLIFIVTKIVKRNAARRLRHGVLAGM